MAITEDNIPKINRIRDLMEDGEERGAEAVAEATQLDRQEVAVSLASEARAGRLERVKQGRYRKASSPPARVRAKRGPGQRVKQNGSSPGLVSAPAGQKLVLTVLATLEDGSRLCLRDDGVVCMATISELGRTR